MDIRRDPDSGRQAVLWLATAFVILFGAAACGFIILAAVDQPSQPLLVLASTFGGIVVVLIMTAFRRDGGGSSRWMLSWLIRERTHPKHVLRIGRKNRKADTTFGTNAPPTLESVRETAEQNVLWVPKGPAPDRRRPK